MRAHRSASAALGALALAALALTLSACDAIEEDRDCTDFATQSAAQRYFESRGGPDRDPDDLDVDRDGVACEELLLGGSGLDIYSTQFDFTPSSATLNGSVLSQQFNVPAIDASVVDAGAVLLYYREQNSWTAMPYTYAVDDPAQKAVSYTISLGFAFEDRFLEVFYEASTDAVNLRQQPARRIKLVVLGPDLAGKRGIDYSNYAEVKAAFGLKD